MTRWGGRQAGFGPVEIAVVGAVVLVLGATGWLLYQHHTSSNKPKAATTTSQTTGQSQTTTTTQTQQTATLDIKAWGVHLTLDSKTASLYYYINPNVPDVAYLSLKTISDIAPDCAADKVSLAAIGRLTEAEQQAIVSNATPGTAGTIQIGSYWYSFQNSHAACVYDSATQQAINKAQPSYDLQSVFKTLAADSASN